ncbi:S8 family serine peptidase [Streptomyces sp. NBC_01341]|uniref:S8 family serine peptidase n=1 Tax=Streptomyces sp. NBC_01341 TaxID=2903831 RepID=UPI002E14B727|nr:S8 family serine peptidase [Streptomyces sp. NBC_01341]
MRRRRRAPLPALVATATLLGLCVSLPTAAPSAADEPGGHAEVVAKPPAEREITLVTGDRVRLTAGGTYAGLIPAKGREKIPTQIQNMKGHTYVLPTDIAGLVASERLDLRLFDVTELSRPAYRHLAGDGLPLIVTYNGARPAARARMADDSGATVRAALDSVNGDALTVGKEGAAGIWRSLTDENGTQRSLAPGVRRVSLDGLVRPSLDISVPQIGAPAAWQAGYDGKGVKIAVLDTGIDTGHPDVGPKVTQVRDFTGSPDALDHYGHGTHVASIVAGTGAQSQGKYRGVAPGAELISGKVLDDRGSGEESGIIAGMEWAVEQGATVVNMSLSGNDTPGLDPLEEAVNRLSDDALFVIAAGNAGPDASTIGSPGSADDALTVGAVDRTDALADFSSRGPRVGEGALKPDLTAPGVDITAAGSAGSVLDTRPGTGHPAPGYFQISGTSMATPHVAGAAAVLAQQHPDWTGRQLKAALVGSAAPGTYRVLDGGGGRVDVAAAIRQTVLAEPVSLNFGTQAWPHEAGEAPITRTVTYRNTGSEDATLDLAVSGTGPGGAPVPAGFFTVGTPRLTVPAGGTASTEVTAHTSAGGSAYGVYDLAVTATGSGAPVRTVGAVTYESPMYDLTLKAIGREGQRPGLYAWSTWVSDATTGLLVKIVSGDDGNGSVRLPQGDYSVTGTMPAERYRGHDWFSAPKLRLRADTTLTFDAREAKEIDVALPDAPTASFTTGAIAVTTTTNGVERSLYLSLGNWELGNRTQQVGPPVPPGELTSYLNEQWNAPGAEYQIAHTRKGSFYTGHTQRVKRSDLAELIVRHGSSIEGAMLRNETIPARGATTGYTYVSPARGETRAYLQGGYSWRRTSQYASGGWIQNTLTTPFRHYTAGRTYHQDVNIGVFGPTAREGAGLVREGDVLTGRISPFSDGAGNTGSGRYDPETASTTLFRDGEKYAVADDVLDSVSFTLPPGEADYRLVTTVGRSEELGGERVSSRISAEYTFTSSRTERAVALPARAVRFAPALAADSTAPGGTDLVVPVTVEGAAAGPGHSPLRVSVSYDGGATWAGSTVRRGRVIVHNPPAGGSVSFRAEVRDRRGTTTQTIIDAYRTR